MNYPWGGWPPPPSTATPSPPSAATGLVVTPMPASVVAEAGKLYQPSDIALTLTLPDGVDDGSQIGLYVYNGADTSVASAATVEMPHALPLDEPLKLASTVIVWVYSAAAGWRLVEWLRLTTGTTPIGSSANAYFDTLFILSIGSETVTLPTIPNGSGVRVAVMRGSGAGPYTLNAYGGEFLWDPIDQKPRASLDLTSWREGAIATFVTLGLDYWWCESFTPGGAPWIALTDGTPDNALPNRRYVTPNAAGAYELVFPDGVPGDTIDILPAYDVVVSAPVAVLGAYGAPIGVAINNVYARFTCIEAGTWLLTERRQLGAGQDLATTTNAAIRPEQRAFYEVDESATLPAGENGMCVSVSNVGALSAAATVFPSPGLDTIQDPLTGSAAASLDLSDWEQGSCCTWQFFNGVWRVIAWYAAPPIP